MVDHDAVMDASGKAMIAMARYLKMYPDSGPRQVMKDLPEWPFLLDNILAFDEAVNLSLQMPDNPDDTLVKIQLESRNCWELLNKALNDE